MENNIIFTADRQKPSNPAYQGNPLIETLPEPVNSAQFYEVIKGRKPYSREFVLGFDWLTRVKLLDTSLREKFLVPNRKLYEIYDLIYSSIVSSYCKRNILVNPIKSELRTNYRNLTQLFQYNYESTFSYSSIIIGITGIGKTTGINTGVSLFPKAMRHIESEYETFVQVPIVKIECPKDGSIKALCKSFFIELDSIVNENYQNEYCKRGDTVDDRVSAMAKLVKSHCIGLLIIDEIQHLSKAKSGGSEMMLNFFLNLDNTLHISILIVGTPEALDLFSDKQRLKRRFSSGASILWDRFPEKKEWSILINQLFKYQYTEELADDETNWSSLFYGHCQGVTDRAVKLFVLTQKLAYLFNSKSITLELVNKAASEMWLDKESFENLRLNKSNVDSDLRIPNYFRNSEDRVKSISNELKNHDIPNDFSLSRIQDHLKKRYSLTNTEICLEIIIEFNEYAFTEASESLGNIKTPEVSLEENDLRNCSTENLETLHNQLKNLGLIATCDHILN